MAEAAQWLVGGLLGLGAVGAALWFALRPMLYPKPRPSGSANPEERGNDAWNDTNQNSTPISNPLDHH